MAQVALDNLSKDFCAYHYTWAMPGVRALPISSPTFFAQRWRGHTHVDWSWPGQFGQ